MADSSDDIIQLVVMDAPLKLTKHGSMGRLSLNRANANNQIDFDLCKRMVKALMDWADDPRVDFVLLDHAEGSAGFSVGTDTAFLAKSGHSNLVSANDYLKALYQLCGLISAYPKPIVSIVDGQANGCAIGLCVSSTYRIATERSCFSFPETGYGSVPHTGATWILSNLSGELGTWLALTGARLRGLEVVSASLASHFCLSRQIPRLVDELASKGLVALSDHLAEPDTSFSKRAEEIDFLFAGECAVRIKDKLQRGSEWAKSQATKLNAKSPLSTKIALRQLRTGDYLGSIREALKIEYRIMTRLIVSQNYREGVRAMLDERDFLPRWRPGSLHNVTYDMVAQYFSPLPTSELRVTAKKVSAHV